MGLLDELLGGGQREQEYQDFVNRYDQGPPYEGISDEEAVSRYQEMAPHLDPDAYQQAAHDSINQLSPEERLQFGQQLGNQAQRQGLSLPGLHEGGDERLGDPGMLASLASGLHQQQPGGLARLLGGLGGGALGGGGGSGPLGNPLARAVLSGITAMATKRLLGSR